MPNYSYTSGAKFRPFSYQEMLQPLAAYTQEYNTIEEALGELGTKSDIFDKLANEQTDSIAYSMYKTYANDLSKQAEILAKNGLTPTSRQDLINMKRRYSSEIVPIEQAWAARAEEAKSQYEGKSKGIVYEGDASTSSLDRYLSNPSIRYNQANSQEGFRRIATAASALAKGLRDYGNGKRLDDYTKTWLQRHGYEDKDIANAISDIQRIINGDTNVDTNEVLRSILIDEMNVSGVNTWKDKDAVNDYFSRVAPALYQAVGQTSISPYEDYKAKLDEQYRMKSTYTDPQSVRELALNPTSVLSPKVRSELEKKVKATIDSYSKYFDTDSQGNLILNKKGIEELRRNDTPRVTISGSGTAALMNTETQMQNSNTKFTPTAFRKFVTEKLGLDPKQIDIDNYDSIGIGNLWSNYLKDPIAIAAGYDTSKYTVYNYALSNSQQDVWKDKLYQVFPSDGLQEVEFDSKTQMFKPTGDNMTLEDFNDKDTRILSVDLSTYGEDNKGNAIWIKDKKGNTKRYKLPSGISEVNENAVYQNLEYAKYLEQIPDGGMLPNGRYVTPEQVQNEYRRVLNTAQFHISQLGLTNDIEKQVTNPYSW